MVDWYYIFSILPLGVYPCSPDIYNVIKLFKLFRLSGCVFRRKSATHSDPNRPPNPFQSGRSFRSKPAAL
jgi:hypothetical protein